LIKNDESESKPYLIVWDNPSMPYSAEDRAVTDRELGAKRSARIAYQCGAKSMTHRPATSDGKASITIKADASNGPVINCVQLHAEKREIDVRFVWLTDRELIF